MALINEAFKQEPEKNSATQTKYQIFLPSTPPITVLFPCSMIVLPNYNYHLCQAE